MESEINSGIERMNDRGFLVEFPFRLCIHGSAGMIGRYALETLRYLVYLLK